MKFYTKILLLFSLITLTSPALPQDVNVSEVKETLNKAIEYFHTLNVHGGYVYYYSLDNQTRWGEEIADTNTIEVQPPGTPAVGFSYLKAYKTTGNKEYLDYAVETGLALVKGQNSYGGWNHTITFGDDDDDEVVSFDDNQTQCAIRFLMATDKVTDNEKISGSVRKALNMMLESQFDNGAWPHKYPEQNNYHDLATFNDETINNNIDVMIEAYKYYGDERYLNSVKKAGDFIIISQQPAPQQGWAQQYDKNLKPAWARTFEPPSISSLVTFNNINTLIDIYLLTGDEKYLQPIPAAFDWLESARLPNGKYPRFVEEGTNKPLYYDRGRKRVNSLEELSRERRLVYGYEQNLDVERDSIKAKYNEVMKLGREGYLKKKEEENNYDLKKLSARVKKIIADLDSKGRWVSVHDKYRDKKPHEKWNGVYAYQDRISSEKFNNNVLTLCRYLNLVKQSY